MSYIRVKEVEKMDMSDIDRMLIAGIILIILISMFFASIIMLNQQKDEELTCEKHNLTYVKTINKKVVECLENDKLVYKKIEKEV